MQVRVELKCWALYPLQRCDDAKERERDEMDAKGAEASRNRAYIPEPRRGRECGCVCESSSQGVDDGGGEVLIRSRM